LALYLAQIAEKHPDLTQIIKAWPNLSDETRRAIVEMSRKARAE
jgi:hypothetical protein